MGEISETVLREVMLKGATAQQPTFTHRKQAFDDAGLARTIGRCVLRKVCLQLLGLFAVGCSLSFLLPQG